MTLKEIEKHLRENGITGLAPFYMQDNPNRADMINYIHIGDEEVKGDYDYIATQDPSRITYAAKFSRKAVGEGYFNALLSAFSRLPAELTMERRIRFLQVEGYYGFATPDNFFYAFSREKVFPIQKIKLTYSFQR